MKFEITFIILTILNISSMLWILPIHIYGESQFNYDQSKSLMDNALDNCASSPSWMMTFKSVFQMSPPKEKCDEVMMALYQFCYKSVSFVEGLAIAFGRTIAPGSLADNVKEKCSDERILNYQYPEPFQNIINRRNMSEKLLNNK